MVCHCCLEDVWTTQEGQPMGVDRDLTSRSARKESLRTTATRSLGKCFFQERTGLTYTFTLTSESPVECVCCLSTGLGAGERMLVHAISKTVLRALFTHIQNHGQKGYPYFNTVKGDQGRSCRNFSWIHCLYFLNNF